LDLGPQREAADGPIRLFRPGTDKAVELPIAPKEFRLTAVRYYSYKDAYFFPDNPFNSDRGKPRSVGWLFPDGKVEKLVIPPAKWAYRTLVPTKAGMVALDSTFFTVTGEAAWDGLYLLGPTGWSQRFSRGLFESHALSKDGCKLAVRRQPDPAHRRPEYWTVTIYDVCQGR
jgi:hypothetical protein